MNNLLNTVSPVLSNFQLVFFHNISILSGKNNDIITNENKVGVVSDALNFNYNLFIRKHVVGFTLPTIPTNDDFGLDIDEDMLDVALIFWHVGIHILNELVYKVNTL